MVKYIIKLLGELPTELSGTRKSSAIYKPKRVGSSWSTKKKVANIYMNYGADYKQKIPGK
jgi:hypothetical protein